MAGEERPSKPTSKVRKSSPVPKEATASALRAKRKKGPGPTSGEGLAPPEVAVERATDAAQRTSGDDPRPDPTHEGPSPVLLVSDVRILHADDPDEPVSQVGSGHPFTIEVLFRVEGSGIDDLDLGEAGLDVEVYADPITPGDASLLAEQRATTPLDQDLSSATLQASGLPKGIYRLITSVTLNEPVRLSGYHDGPVMSVA